MWLLNCLRGDNGHVAPLNWLMGLFMLKEPAQIRWKTPVPVWAATSRPACVSLSCILLDTRCVCRHGKTTNWGVVMNNRERGQQRGSRFHPQTASSAMFIKYQPLDGGANPPWWCWILQQSVAPHPERKWPFVPRDFKHSCNGLNMWWGLPFLETQRFTADLQKSKPGPKTSLWFLQGS